MGRIVALLYLWLGLPLMLVARVALPLGGFRLLLALLLVIGRLFFEVPAMQVAWGISSIPFVTYIPPYFLGLAILPRRI